MTCVPVVAKLVVQAAVPAVSGTALQAPITMPPSANATLPVGPLPVTVAVMVTLCPGAAGLGAAVRPMVDAVDAVAVKAADWLPITPL